ncbi:HPF/RaiA family ribosome-associated protein [Aquimonas voraii]|uniref:Ribosome-associated translation inhibitor RaiA n=1 Tax=Aquimonas voraii TaxID=265719 RepID=A0A1G7A202_9GAMM|nr:HPF/RaiA family ribosome-associated protein [Aquimonas voraii]SDE07926.1 Ribosome-associated translation inhibitor RaiA [Aquimonas voraii]
MQIDTHTHGFELTPGLSEHLRRRLRFALGRIGASVQRVVVRLSDINADRGGVDKRCRLQLQMPGRPDVVVEDTRSDLYAAIGSAVERAARTLGRRSGRLRQLMRRGHGALPARFSRWPSETGQL